ncbi:MAG: PqqD family protein [Actinomycetota bacterium]
MNRTGTALWPLLDRGTDQQELVARLMAEFGIDAEAAERDVEAFVDALRRKGLLEEGDRGTPDRTDGPAPGG